MKKARMSHGCWSGWRVMAALAMAASARATERYVWQGGAHTGGFTNWAGAATNIQAAIDAASDGDIIWVTNGTYSSTGAVANGAMISLTKGVELRSVNGPDCTFINGNWPAISNSCFYINHAQARVCGFTITNGYAPLSPDPVGARGGGVHIRAGIVTNCAIMYNRAHYTGGGVYCRGDNLLANCLIAGNMATNWANGVGGGVQVVDAASVVRACVISNNTSSKSGAGVNMSAGTVEDCVIMSNTVTGTYQNGGGVAMTGGKMKGCAITRNTGAYRGGGVGIEGAVLEDCTIQGHGVGESGGGIYFTGAAATALNCRVVGNMSVNNGSGGGAYIRNGCAMIGCTISGNWAGATSNLTAGGVTMTGGLLRNCVITANAGNDGAGVYLASGTPVIENCTIVSNINTWANRGAVLTAAGVAATVRNCIIYFNWNGNLTRGGSDSVTYTCTTPAASGEGNIADDPGFVSLGAMDIRLVRRSRCLNSGLNADWMHTATDCAGNPRVLGGRVDMGAHETRIPRGSVFEVE